MCGTLRRMITCRVYRDGTLEEERPFDSADVVAAQAAGARVWLEGIAPTEDELRRLQETFGLHELSIEDSSRWGQRSKVEFYSDYVFVVTHVLRLDDDDRLYDAEVHLFAGRGSYVITLRRDTVQVFDGVPHRLAGSEPLAGEGIGFLVYLLLDEIADGYLNTVERLEDLSDDIEDQVFAEHAEVDVQEDLFRLKRTVVRFRRFVSPMREVVDLLQEAPGLVTAELIPYYRDVQDHVIRALEFIDNIRDLLTSALEAQLAQVSNRLNIVMKQVTSWAAIILIPTLVAGIYGMNFRHMPELSWQVGYPVALGIMAASAFFLYRVFKRRDWL